MADALDKRSAEGLDAAVEKAFNDAEKDVYEYEGRRYTAHAAATLFPLLRGENFDALVSSLKLYGMRNPVLLLGDRIVDGRNRFRAAKKAGVRIIFEHLDPGQDPCVVAMILNIHRRDMETGRKVLVASQLRRMAIRLEQLRREALAKADREKAAREQGSAAPVPEGSAAEEQVEGRPSGTVAPVSGQEPPGDADSGSGPGAGPAAGVEAAAGALEGEPPSGLERPSALVSRAKAAEVAGVSRSSLDRVDKVIETAPELEEAIADGKLSVRDAAVVSQEEPDLRRQVVDDVKAGRARTGAEAIEKRTGRAPKARSRPKASGGAKAQGDGGGVAGMPPLPSLGAAADGKTGAAPAASSVASGEVPPQRSARPLLPELALSPSLLMAGVRKVMPAIEFDPCSSETAQERIRALNWLSKEQDGCSRAWGGASYVFPPPQFAGRFASKLMGEMLAGRVPHALFFAPSDMGDEHEGLLLRSPQLTGIVHELERSMFDLEDGKSVKAPSRMVLYVFGFDRKVLYDPFDPWGKVLTVSSGR